MHITIIGAGAIGGTTGVYLSAAGHDVLLVDNVREHVDAINRQGLRISGIRGDRTFPVQACLPDALKAPLGFVILAVKAQHTEAALAPVVPLLADDGFVVSMQNGLNEEIIARRVGPHRTVGCFVHFGADYQEPGHILLGNEHPIYVGELDGSITPRVGMIAEALRAVMPAAVTDHIWDWLWTKMCYGSLYFAGALLDAPLHGLSTRAHSHWPHRPRRGDCQRRALPGGQRAGVVHQRGDPERDRRRPRRSCTPAAEPEGRPQGVRPKGSASAEPLPHLTRSAHED